MVFLFVSARDGLAAKRKRAVPLQIEIAGMGTGIRGAACQSYAKATRRSKSANCRALSLWRRDMRSSLLPRHDQTRQANVTTTELSRKKRGRLPCGLGRRPRRQWVNGIGKPIQPTHPDG